MGFPYRIDKLLIQSVEEYLDLFGSKDNFTPQNAVAAMIYHYIDIRMVDFYLNVYRKDFFILSYDKLSISIGTNSSNYLCLSLVRSFKFEDNSDEMIEIHLDLHFEDIIDNSRYSNYISLSRLRLSDEDESYEKEIDKITDDIFYKQIVNRIPTKFDLYLNYNV